MIVAKDDDFFLVRSKRPGATYRIPYYALKPWGAWCKVDILIPGALLKIIVDNHPYQIVGHQRWVPHSIILAAQERVDEFVREQPGTKSGWLYVGFKAQSKNRRHSV